MKRTKSPKPEFGLAGIGIPAEVLFNPEITNTEKILFGFIQSLSATEKGCWASNEWLAGMMGVSSQTITNGISKLKKYGYIFVRVDKKIDGNFSRTIFINKEYPLIYREMLEEAYKNIYRGVLKNLYTPIKKFIHPYKNIYTYNNIYNNIDNNYMCDIKKLEAENLPEKIKEKSDQNKNKKYIPLARKLSRIIKKTKNIKHPANVIKKWADEIRKLVEINEVEFERVDIALDWYAENIGGEYIPVIESGSSLREKFMKLENAIDRANSKGVQKNKQKKYDSNVVSLSDL